MVIDINQTYCGDHFAIYTSTEPFYFIPETNIMLYKLYLNKKVKFKTYNLKTTKCCWKKFRGSK